MTEGSGELLSADGAPGPTHSDDPRPSLVLLLAQAEHTLRGRIEPALAQAGLSYDHWRIMSVLLARPGSRMSAIAEEAVLPAPTLTRHMDLLVERAMVVRRIDPADKRRVVAALSSTGQDLAHRLRRVEETVEGEIADGLGSARFATMCRELGLLPHVFG